MKTKLILNNHDARIHKIDINPKNIDTSIVLYTKIYDEDVKKIIKCKLLFKEVSAIDFQINYFDNCIGSEGYGLYEIIENTYKKNLINKVFDYRKEMFLKCGYNYDENDKHDILNYKNGLNQFSKKIKDYHLYVQNVDAGVYIILSKKVEIIK